MTTETKTEMSDEELGLVLAQWRSWADLGRKARELLEPAAEARGRRKALADVDQKYNETFCADDVCMGDAIERFCEWLAAEQAPAAQTAPAPLPTVDSIRDVILDASSTKDWTWRTVAEAVLAHLGAQPAGRTEGETVNALNVEVERLTRERDDLESWKEHAMASLGRWNKLHSELQRGPYAVRRGHYMTDEVVRILREQRAKLEAQDAEIERLRSTNVLMREAMSTFPPAPLPTPAEVYISARTDDGTELACERRSAWDARADHNGVTGSPFRVVSEFSATSWDEAMREHNYIHGLGEYKPIEATPMPRLETELSRLWSECIKPSGLSESMTWMGTNVFRRAARADLAEARKADAARIAELEGALDACQETCRGLRDARDDLSRELAANAQAARELSAKGGK